MAVYLSKQLKHFTTFATVSRKSLHLKRRLKLKGCLSNRNWYPLEFAADVLCCMSCDVNVLCLLVLVYFCVTPGVMGTL